MVKAVIFDMDGILIDSEMMYQKRMIRYLKHLGVSYTMEDIRSLAGGSYPMYQRFVRDVVKQDTDIQTFLQQMNDYCGGPFRDYPSILFPYVKDALYELKERGYRLALASSSSRQSIETVLNSCGLRHLFEFFLSGQMFQESKPHPEIYLTAAKRLQLPCEQCTVIEDSNYGITAGKRAGMRVIARREDRFAFDQSMADAFFDDYRELPAMIGSGEDL